MLNILTWFVATALISDPVKSIPSPQCETLLTTTPTSTTSATTVPTTSTTPTTTMTSIIPCAAVNNCSGHYSCGPYESRVCLPGWTGTNCDVLVTGGQADCDNFDWHIFEPSKWKGNYTCSADNQELSFLLNITQSSSSIETVGDLEIQTHKVTMIGAYAAFFKTFSLQSNTLIAKEKAGKNITNLTLNGALRSSVFIQGAITFLSDNGAVSCPMEMRRYAVSFNWCNGNGSCFRNSNKRSDYTCCHNQALDLKDSLTVGCGQDGWNIAINMTILRKLYPDTDVSQIKLTNNLCTGKTDGDLLLFRQSYTECATESKSQCVHIWLPNGFNLYQTSSYSECHLDWNCHHCASSVQRVTEVSDTSVRYTNNILYPEATSPFPLIFHGYRWQLPVECDISRGQIIGNNYHPNHSISHQTPNIGPTSYYNATVKFFSSGSFNKEITGNPVTLKTGEDVFVQVKMNSKDSHVKMVLDTCYAEPSPNADKSQTYTLINKGCIVDPDTRILSQGTHETRLVFNAFEFSTSNNYVYVYCNTTYCGVTDTSQKCSQICHTGLPGLVGRDIAALDQLDQEDEI